MLVSGVSFKFVYAGLGLNYQNGEIGGRTRLAIRTTESRTSRNLAKSQT